MSFSKFKNISHFNGKYHAQILISKEALPLIQKASLVQNKPVSPMS